MISTATLIAVAGIARGEDGLTFSKAQIYVEFNASAQDVGIQVLLDGEPWKRVRVLDPRERPLLDIVARRNVRTQGLTELFFESSEPSLDELPLPEFLARFPEGEYEFQGRTLSGAEIEGEATLSHLIPAGPEILSPVSPTDEPPVVDPANLTIEWVPVTESIDGEPVEIVEYQVIVEQEDPLRVFGIHVPASVTSLAIPPEFFLLPGTLHKFEVLAIERNRNQTITEGEFVTLP
jgi:hypothetical protein